VHAHNKSSPYQKCAWEVIEDAIKGRLEACLTAQIIYEFFAVITNPKRVESPLKLDQAVEVSIDFWECCEIEKIHPSSNAVLSVLRIAKEVNLSRSQIFDCVIAVTAKDNKVECIYTENVDDFKNYSFLRAVNPFEDLGARS